MIASRNTHTIMFALLVGTLASPPTSAQTLADSLERDAPKPKEIYHDAWTFVRDVYFDPTYNGQDWSRWEHRYDHHIHDTDDCNLAIKSMMASLADRYSRLVDASEFDDEQEQIDFRFFGVGLHCGLSKSGKFEIIDPIPRTPAFKAGLQSRDLVVAIDGEPTPASVEDACRKIRGPKDTKVTLTVLRDGRIREFCVTRAEIPVHCVYDCRMLDSKIGYLRIDSFMYSESINDIRENLQRLKNARGIIIDLRGNPGGLLSNALELTQVFLPEGEIVSTVDGKGKVETARVSDKSPTSNKPPLFLYQQKLVVLVDGGTASASEIFSGAMQDNRRAILVGDKTYGKGHVNSFHRPKNGAGLCIVICRYRTPNGREIENGLVPDVVFALSDEQKKLGLGPWYSTLASSSGDRDRDPLSFGDLQLRKGIQVMTEHLASSTPRLVVPDGLRDLMYMGKKAVGLND